MTIFASSAQIRAARAMLDWSLIYLAKAADVSISTVVRAEGRSPEQVAEGTLGAIRVAMETAGVCFLENEGDGAGVRLRALPS